MPAANPQFNRPNLGAFVPWKQWRRERAATVFPTDSSFEWFFRQHREEIIRSGEWLPRKGRSGDLAGPGLDGVVLAILRRQAGLIEAGRA